MQRGSREPSWLYSAYWKVCTKRVRGAQVHAPHVENVLLRGRFVESFRIDGRIDLDRRHLAAAAGLTAGSDGECSRQIDSAEILPLGEFGDLLALATLRDLLENASGRRIDIPLERRAVGVDLEDPSGAF